MSLNGVIERKLALLEEYRLQLQAALEGVSLPDFTDSWVLRRTAERSLQVMIEVIIDIAERVLAARGAGPAASAAEAMEMLVMLKVLPSADPFRQMVRFRNLIVHQYEALDPALLYELATSRLDDFRLFRDSLDLG